MKTPHPFNSTNYSTHKRMFFTYCELGRNNYVPWYFFLFKNCKCIINCKIVNNQYILM